MLCRPVRFGFVVWLVLSSGLLASAVAGVNRAANATQRYHEAHWTAEDGIPQNRINALAQTPDGYLWIGTWRGLARFDGLRFTAFTEVNSPAMVNHTINALTVDQDGKLWIGTGEGLLVYHDGQFTRFTTDNGLPNREVWRFAPSRAGGVWMNSGGYVVHWHTNRPTVAVKVVRSGDEDVRSLRENDDCSVTVVTSDGVKRVTLQGEVEEEPSPPDSPPRPWGGAWRQHRERRFWVSTSQALWLFGNGFWNQVQRGRSDGVALHFMYEDRSGCLWVNRRGAGLWRCVADSAEPVTLGVRGAETAVNCMLEDAEGQIWLGTSEGLFRLRPRLIRTFTTDDGLPHDECWSVCEAPDGAIWVESRWGGSARIQNERVQTPPDVPARSPRYSILVDPSGTVWLGNGHNGLISWRPGVQTNSFWRNASPRVTLDALYVGRDGRVWVGTERGATWFENGRLAAKWGEFGLPTNGVRSIYQTRDGAMWFGTWRHGVVRWESASSRNVAAGHVVPAASPPESTAGRAEDSPADVAKVTRYSKADGLADDRVFVFHEDAEGTLWIGTRNGLSRLTFSQPPTPNPQPRFFTFRTEQGLPDNPIHWLEEDEFGRLWFSCNRGIFRIDRQELNAVAKGRKSRANAAVYGTADGMISPATNGEHQPAGCKARDGRFWFPTPQGLVMIDPRVIKDNDVPPPTVIEQVVADGEVIYGDGVARSWRVPNPRGDDPARALGVSASGLVVGTAATQEGSTPALRLPPGRAGLLKIQYTANSFADPRRVRFQYQLAGRDRDWREVTEERAAYYTDLKPGRYSFRVKAANAHGVWNERPATFSFSLAPHFYQTWPFYVLCGACVVLGGFGVHHRRVSFLRRIERLEREQALQAERARIARDLHDDLGANLTGIALKADLARRQTSPGADQSAAGQLASIAASTRVLVDNMRETVWALNPKHDTLESLARFLAQQAEDFVTSAGLRCRLELPDRLPPFSIPSPARYDIHMVVKEALHNAVKHAGAREVQLSLQIDAQDLCLRIVDDGHGFDPDNRCVSTANASFSEGGNGLANMRQRVESMGGRWHLQTGVGQGTCITIRIPTRSFRKA